MKRAVVRPTMPRPSDALGEAVASIVTQPGRAILGCVGTLLGATWFVTMLGLASTASAQVTVDFADRKPTVVIVTHSRGSSPVLGHPYPADVEQRLDALPGVLAAGVFWQLKPGVPVAVTSWRSGDLVHGGGLIAGGPSSGGLAVIAATPGFLAAARVEVSVGRAFGAWDQVHAAPACLVGELAARSLGITALRGRPAIVINQVSCVVVGIVGRVAWQQALLRSVLLPSSAAIALWGAPDAAAGARPTVLIRTRPGAAGVVARQAPFAISAAGPRQYVVSVPSAPLRLADRVTGALSTEFLLLCWLGLVSGVLAITVLTVISVLDRAAEFGLRRAVGAGRRDVAAQILAESVITGLIGGLAGTSLGVAVVVIVARANNWLPVIQPTTILYAPLVAATTGTLTGLLACVAGARVTPAAVLRTVA